MKKNWWLELYTLPALKKLGLVSLIVSFSSLLIPLSMLDLVFYANFFILVVHYKNHANSFGNNIEFHKMHVPFEKLRKSLLLDILLQAFSVNVACLIPVLILSTRTDSSIASDAFEYGKVYLLGSLLHLLRLGGVGPKATYQLISSEMHLLKRWFASGMIILSMLFCTVFLATLWLTEFGIMVILGGTLFLGLTLFVIKAMFHQEVKRGGLLTIVKYEALGFVGTSIIYVLCSTLAMPLINVTSINPEIRLTIFRSAGRFAPELSLERAKEFLVTQGVGQLGEHLVYSKLPNAGDVPLTELVPTLTPGFILCFLKYTQPSKENRLYILDLLERGRIKGVAAERVTAELVSKWPNGEKVPEHLSKLAKEISRPKLKRQISSEGPSEERP